jgi:hypothetical protein
VTGRRHVAVRATVVTFDVISTTTPNGSGPAQRTSGHAASVVAAGTMSVRGRLSGLGRARVGCERSLSAHSLLKERRTMAAIIAETIPYTLVATEWNVARDQRADERSPKARARDDGFAGGLADVINTVMSNWRLLP